MIVYIVFYFPAPVLNSWCGASSGLRVEQAMQETPLQTRLRGAETSSARRNNARVFWQWLLLRCGSLLDQGEWRDNHAQDIMWYCCYGDSRSCQRRRTGVAGQEIGPRWLPRGRGLPYRALWARVRKWWQDLRELLFLQTATLHWIQRSNIHSQRKV